METQTQTTILNLVISAKNQEKSQEIIQKLNVPQYQQQQIYKVNIYNNIFHVNITLVKINHNLSMKFFKRSSDNKTAENLPEEIRNFVCRKF